jgi:hypothetical protein
MREEFPDSGKTDAHRAYVMKRSSERLPGFRRDDTSPDAPSTDDFHVGGFQSAFL